MNRITPQDVGRRVSVRRELAGEGPRPMFGDVVGDLTAWRDGVLTITRRDGGVVRVAEASVVASRVVVEPSRRLTALRLQELADHAWPASHRARVGAWVLRATGEATDRARVEGRQDAADVFIREADSVLPLGDPGIAIPEALARVRAWYAEHAAPALFQVIDGDPLEAVLADAGWDAEASTLVRTGRLVRVGSVLRSEGAADVRVDVGETLTDAWLSGCRGFGGRPGPGVRRVSAGPVGGGTVFASVSAPEGGVPLAIGRVCVQGRYAGFSAVEVDPGHRRRGLARAVVRALVDEATRRGAVTGWLHVEAGNTPAVAWSDALGFVTHHRCHYRRDPAGDGTGTVSAAAK